MAIDALLSRLEVRPVVTSVTADHPPDVTLKPAPVLVCTSVTSVTSESTNAGAQTAEPAYWAWRVRYPSGAEFRCHFTPEQTRSQVQAAHPEAISIEPIERELGEQVDLETADEAMIRAWLTHISETDPELIEEVLDRCRRYPEDLAYFAERASAACSLQQWSKLDV